MSFIITLALLGCGGFIFFTLAHSLILLSAFFFVLFCGLLFLMDQHLEEKKRIRIARLIKSTQPTGHLSPLNHSFSRAKPLAKLNQDAFSNIDWTPGLKSHLPESHEDPEFGKIPSFKHVRKEIYEAWLDSAEK